jgi:hypothetical protein
MKTFVLMHEHEYGATSYAFRCAAKNTGEIELERICQLLEIEFDEDKETITIFSLGKVVTVDLNDVKHEN